MIYFDLDGVIRDLHSCVEPKQKFLEWNSPIKGRNFLEYFDENLHLLVESRPTEYYEEIILWNDSIPIITSQPYGWRENTLIWIEKYLPKATVIFDSEKLHLLKEGDYIVEDYPNYNDYSKVILIDRPYNRCVRNPLLRIKKPIELRRFLNDTFISE